MTKRLSSPSKPSYVFFWTFSSLALLLAWDLTGFDLPMAHWFGSSQGFPFTDHWFWRGVLHTEIRPVPWMVELALCLSVFWPFGPFKNLELARRLQLALGTLLALVVISSLKYTSYTSCPWNLHEFGGTAAYVSHWAWGIRDGGGGNCFPAGHASAGFAFMVGFFAFRHTSQKIARYWLLAAMAAGLTLGLAQQIRGAHFMSHTLWTAWLCWSTAALLDLGVTQWLARKTPVLTFAATEPSRLMTRL